MNSLQASLSALALVVSGSVTSAYAADCQTAQFSDEVVARFPNIRKACLDVVDVNGEQRAVIKTKLTKVYPYPDNRLEVRVALPDGTYSKPKVITTKPDFRAMVNGKPVRAENLPINQELTAYVKVEEPAIALAPAEPSQPAEFVPLTPERPAHVAAAMPRTDGNRFVLLWFGLAFAVAGNAASLLLTYTSRRRIAGIGAQE